MLATKFAHVHYFFAKHSLRCRLKSSASEQKLWLASGVIGVCWILSIHGDVCSEQIGAL